MTERAKGRLWKMAFDLTWVVITYRLGLALPSVCFAFAVAWGAVGLAIDRGWENPFDLTP